MVWMEPERAALATTARAADPDGPTLCDGWSVRRLLAHLVQRELRPVRSAADMASRRPPGDERFLGRLVADARTPAGYQALVDRFEEGRRPRWSPLSWAGDRAHLLEYVVHHEDIRRAGTDPAPPRDLPDDQLQAVWQHLTSASKLLLRRSPVGVTLEAPGRARREVRKEDAAMVTVGGEPVELALHLFGRQAVAAVEIVGPPAARATFEAWAG